MANGSPPRQRLDDDVENDGLHFARVREHRERKGVELSPLQGLSTQKRVRLSADAGFEQH